MRIKDPFGLLLFDEFHVLLITSQSAHAYMRVKVLYKCKHPFVVITSGDHLVYGVRMRMSYLLCMRPEIDILAPEQTR